MDQSILREYLVALGFRINTAERKKFDDGLTGLDKKATALARSIVGVAAATQAMVSVFAYQMEKLWYSSKKAESSVGNLQALEYGTKQIGLAGGQGRAALEGMARAIRSNPGLIGLLNSLGVQVHGRDKADVMTDLVAQLKKMPFFVAERYANLFGIDPDTLLLLIQGLDKMKEAVAERKKMAAEMGIDTEAAAKAGLEYAQTWRTILERVGLFKDALSIELLPAMRELAAVTNEVLMSWTKIIRTPREQFVKDMKLGLGIDEPEGDRAKLTPEAAARAEALRQGEDPNKVVVPQEQKTPLEMTPKERKTRGLPEDALDLKYPDLSPEERKQQYDKPTRIINEAMTGTGLQRPGGGVELSKESKARLGLPEEVQTSETSVWRRWFEKGMEALGGRNFKPAGRRAPDPEAIEAVTAPDRVQIEREKTTIERDKTTNTSTERSTDTTRTIERNNTDTTKTVEQQTNSTIKTDTTKIVEQAVQTPDTAPESRAPVPSNQIRNGDDYRRALAARQVAPVPGVPGEPGLPGEAGQAGRGGAGGAAGQAGRAGGGGEGGAAGQAGLPGVAGRGGDAGQAGRGGSAGQSGRGGEGGAAGQAGAPGRPGLPGEAPSVNVNPTIKVPSAPQVKAGTPEEHSYLAQLEVRYALPKGLLDRVWKTESGRGANTLGPVTRSGERAEGPFQFMPATAKEYGVKNTQDFKQSAAGSAAYFADLLKRYTGDLKMAAAAYNWGPGKLDAALTRAMDKHPNASPEQIDKFALGSAPRETREYVEKVAGQNAAPVINQSTRIIVQGSTNPRETADAVSGQQREVNADMVRQFTPRVF